MVEAEELGPPREGRHQALRVLLQAHDEQRRGQRLERGGGHQALRVHLQAHDAQRRGQRLEGGEGGGKEFIFMFVLKGLP